MNGSNSDTLSPIISVDNSLDFTISLFILSPVSVIPSEIFSLTFSTILSPVFRNFPILPLLLTLCIVLSIEVSSLFSAESVIFEFIS